MVVRKEKRIRHIPQTICAMGIYSTIGLEIVAKYQVYIETCFQIDWDPKLPIKSPCQLLCRPAINGELVAPSMVVSLGHQ